MPVEVGFDAALPLENTATVAGGGEVDTANDEAVDSASPEPAADLAIAKTGEPDEPRPGEEVTYVLQVSDNGPAAATGVVVDDPPPAGLTVLAADVDQGACDTTVHCALGTLIPGQMVRVTVHATVADAAPAGPLTNAATVAGEQRDPHPDNNRATAGVRVRATADVRLAKRLLGTAHAGRTVAWAITAVNHGPHRADGLVVVDALPRAVEAPAAEVTLGAGHCSVADRVARCRLHALAPGERAEIRVHGRLAAGTGGTFLDNGAELFEREDDPAPRAAAHGDQAVVEPAADVEISASATPTVPIPGGLLTYHVRVADRGPQSARGVRVVVHLPAAVTPISMPKACTVAVRVVRCDVRDLAPGAELRFTLVARVTRGAAQRLLSATLRVSESRPDPATADNRDVATTRAGRAPARPDFTG